MTTATESFDVIIIGAGAAGLMCALTAGQRGRKVLLLDHADKVGAKILISGGGRCNFTNLHSAPDRFLSGNPDFCKSALGRYTQTDFIALVERHGIPYHEKTLGQLFCDGSARAIVAMLLAECAQGGVDLRVGHTVTDISRADSFRVETAQQCFTAPALVLATGGLSIPKMGATGFAYDVARRFGLSITEPQPGLVPLTADARGARVRPASRRRFAGSDRILRGNRAFAKTSCSRTAASPVRPSCKSPPTGGRAIRSPRPGAGSRRERLSVGAQARRGPRPKPKTVLAEILPARLAQALAEACLPPGPMANIPDRTLAAFAARLKRWEVQPAGSEGLPKAEVTLGGIDTRDLSSKTMEARNVPGLYAIGEAVDVTGWLGGYNFQWAWSSGWCAGQAIA